MKAALRSIKMKSFLAAFVVLVIFCESNECFAVKKSASPERNSENMDSGMDKILVSYDEYPMVVPKRAAMLLDRLMVALHHALEDGDKEGVQRINELYNRRVNKEDDGLSKGNANQYNGNEHEMNYEDIPVLLNDENDLTQIEGRHSADDTMGLQRRGHEEVLGPNKGRVYWRCYFNAVTCF